MNITRSGVRNRCRPIRACRPTGPPTISESPPTRTSLRLGRSRSSALRRSVANCSGEVFSAVTVPVPARPRSDHPAAGRLAAGRRPGAGAGGGGGAGAGSGNGTVVGGPSGMVIPAPPRCSAGSRFRHRRRRDGITRWGGGVAGAGGGTYTGCGTPAYPPIGRFGERLRSRCPAERRPWWPSRCSTAVPIRTPVRPTGSPTVCRC